MSIIIKEFQNKYYSQLVEVINSVLSEYDFTFDIGDIKNDLNLLKENKSYSNRNEKFWVALDNKKVIGSIAIRQREDDDLAELKRFYLLPEYRGLGYGSKLYNTAEKFALSMAYSGIWLESSRKFKSAAKLYHKKGFVLIEELDNDWEDNLYHKKFERIDLMSIKLNLNILESLIYFWEASKSGEKVGEKYIASIAGDENMKLVYSNEFDENSVRKVLSAISNREKLRGNDKERKFWNNNMWMMDDLSFMRDMVKPIKTLSMNRINDDLDLEEDYELIFLPLCDEEKMIKDNKVILNFFKVKLDPMDFKKVEYADKPIYDYIEEVLENLR